MFCVRVLLYEFIIQAALRIPPGQVVRLRCCGGARKGIIIGISVLPKRIQWFDEKVVAFTVVMGPNA